MMINRFRICENPVALHEEAVYCQLSLFFSLPSHIVQHHNMVWEETRQSSEQIYVDAVADPLDTIVESFIGLKLQTTMIHTSS